MSLVPLEQVRSLFACPRCSADLAERADAYECQACGARYPVIAGWPALIDFDQSVIEEAQLREREGNSPLTRSAARRTWHRVQHTFFGDSREAIANLREFVAALKLVSERPRLLIIGGGTVGAGAVPTLYEDADIELIAFDIYGSPNTQFIGDAHRIPLKTASVDGVLIQAVLEHVLDPWKVVEEIHRVLVPGGVVYAETPFLQHVHEGPYDFTRFTDSGHRWLFRRFELIKSGALLGPGIVAQWVVENTVTGLLKSKRAGVLAKSAIFWVRFVDRLMPRAYAVDGASAVYFIGRRSEKTISPREVVAHYRGAQRRHKARPSA